MSGFDTKPISDLIVEKEPPSTSSPNKLVIEIPPSIAAVPATEVLGTQPPVLITKAVKETIPDLSPETVTQVTKQVLATQQPQHLTEPAKEIPIAKQEEPAKEAEPTRQVLVAKTQEAEPAKQAQQLIVQALRETAPELKQALLVEKQPVSTPDPAQRIASQDQPITTPTPVIDPVVVPRQEVVQEPIHIIAEKRAEPEHTPGDVPVVVQQTATQYLPLQPLVEQQLVSMPGPAKEAIVAMPAVGSETNAIPIKPIVLTPTPTPTMIVEARPSEARPSEVTPIAAIAAVASSPGLVQAPVQVVDFAPSASREVPVAAIPPGTASDPIPVKTFTDSTGEQLAAIPTVRSIPSGEPGQTPVQIVENTPHATGEVIVPANPVAEPIPAKTFTNPTGDQLVAIPAAKAIQTPVQVVDIASTAATTETVIPPARSSTLPPVPALVSTLPRTFTNATGEPVAVISAAPQPVLIQRRNSEPSSITPTTVNVVQAAAVVASPDPTSTVSESQPTAIVEEPQALDPTEDVKIEQAYFVPARMAKVRTVIVKKPSVVASEEQSGISSQEASEAVLVAPIATTMVVDKDLQSTVMAEKTVEQAAVITSINAAEESKSVVIEEQKPVDTATIAPAVVTSVPVQDAIVAVPISTTTETTTIVPVSTTQSTAVEVQAARIEPVPVIQATPVTTTSASVATTNALLPLPQAIAAFSTTALESSTTITYKNKTFVDASGNVIFTITSHKEFRDAHNSIIFKLRHFHCVGRYYAIGSEQTITVKRYSLHHTLMFYFRNTFTGEKMKMYLRPDRNLYTTAGPEAPVAAALGKGGVVKVAAGMELALVAAIAYSAKTSWGSEGSRLGEAGCGCLC